MDEYAPKGSGEMARRYLATPMTDTKPSDVEGLAVAADLLDRQGNGDIANRVRSAATTLAKLQRKAAADAEWITTLKNEIQRLKNRAALKEPTT